MRIISAPLAACLLTVPLASPVSAVSTATCTTLAPALGQTVTCTVPTSGAVVTVPAGATTLTATVLGGGGGGGWARDSGSTAGNGANGASVEAAFDISGASSVTVDVGAGGAGGVESAPANAVAGDPSQLSIDSALVVLAAGGGAGAWATCGISGSAGTPANGSYAIGPRLLSSSIGGTGGAGGTGAISTGTPVNGNAGGDGLITFTFTGAEAPAPSSEAHATPVFRHFAWRGDGNGQSSSTFTDGTWQSTPTAQEWTRPGFTLLGWATHRLFPVDRARAATSAFDGEVDGQRMIYIPAGKPTFVSGDVSLYAIWDTTARTHLIARC